VPSSLTTRRCARAARGIFAALVAGGCAAAPAAVIAPSPVEPEPAAAAAPAVVPAPAMMIPREAEISQQGMPARTDSTSEPPREIAIPPRAQADAAAAVIALPELPSWDIDVHSYETTTRVAHYVSRFTGPSREYIASRLSTGTKYESMIRDALRKGGIPEDMYYLALVESGFNPNAYSSAAAVGMWQFMTTTARGMGLRVDWWVDERRDPIRSTKAAVLFLGGLREQFGSIYLAAAAYNGGPGRIARGLTRYADDLDGTEGDDLFFALAEKNYLRSETREYVPQIIAAALIAKEPARYGIEVRTLPAYVYDSVRVPALTSLAAVARAAGTTLSALKELNPQILRGMMPPRDSVSLRLPLGSGERFDSAFAGIPDSLRAGARVVRTKGGETPQKLAKLTGVASKQIGVFNKSLKRAKNGTYLAGQVVYVPTADAVAGATSVPDPSIERYGSTARGTHIVRKGETLSGIAKRYGTTTAALMRVNGLKKSLIFAGQQILVSRSAAARPKPPAKKPAVVKSAATKSAKPPGKKS
jgi:membrane-bound lytic murein transglycosylase D